MANGFIAIIKKYLVIFILTLLAILTICFLVFVPIKTEVVAPTCETNGYTVMSSVLGVKYYFDEKEALGHDYENGVCIQCSKESQTNVTRAEFIIDNAIVDELTLKPNSTKQIDLYVYDDTDLAEKTDYSVDWSFNETSTELSVNKSGFITIGNIAGSVTLTANVSAANTYIATLPIKIILDDNIVINNISVEFRNGNKFIEGQTLTKHDMTVWGEFESGRIQLTDYEFDEFPLKVDTEKITVYYRNFSVVVSIIVSPKTLQSLYISTPPVKTEYYIGQYFDMSGLSVVAKFEFIEEEVTPYVKTEIAPFEMDDTEVILSYTYNGVTKTVSQPITVLPKIAIPIKSVEILVNDSVVTEYSVILPENKFEVTLRVNNGQEIDPETETYSVYWSFSGDAYGSEVTKNGVVTVDNVIGTVTLSVTVIGSNSVTMYLPIKVSYDKNILVLNSLSALLNENVEYIEGQAFNVDDVKLWGTFGSENTLIRILNFECENDVLTSETTELILLFEDKVAVLPVAVQGKSLQSIEIVAPPSKTQYYDGQTFDSTGMKVVAHFEYLQEEITPNIPTTQLKIGDTEIVISFTYNGVTKTVSQSVIVTPKKLLSITVDDSNVQKLYTQYDVFNPKGLIVKATYDYFGEMEVQNFSYTNKKLDVSDTKIEITVQEGDVIKSAYVYINVFKPYEKIVNIKVLIPADVSITWEYIYHSADGDICIDNTSYTEHDLTYDKVNGNYEVPLGANVTAMIRNPAGIGLIINGEEITVDSDSKLYSWDIRGVESISIGIIEMSGKHYVVRFIGDEKEQSFLFSASWDGKLSQNNLNSLSTVFAETQNYYYSYLIGGDIYRYENLNGYVFSGDTTVNVTKNAITDSPVTIKIHSIDDLIYTITIDENQISTWEIPIVTLPSGYIYDGLALTPNGVKLTENEIRSLLIPNTTLDLYVLLITETIDYSSMYIVKDNSGTQIIETDDISGMEAVKLVGTWTASFVEESNNYRYSLQLNSDGTFVYEGYINEVQNCYYFGMYRLSGNQVVIISCESTMDIMIINSSDFSISAQGLGIQANAVVVSQNSLVYYTIMFKSISV